MLTRRFLSFKIRTSMTLRSYLKPIAVKNLMVALIFLVTFLLGNLSANIQNFNVDMVKAAHSYAHPRQRHLNRQLEILPESAVRVVLLVVEDTNKSRLHDVLMQLEAVNFSRAVRIDLSIQLFQNIYQNDAQHQWLNSFLDKYSWSYGKLDVVRDVPNVLDALLYPWDTFLHNYEYLIYLDTKANIGVNSYVWNHAATTTFNGHSHFFGSSPGFTPIKKVRYDKRNDKNLTINFDLSDPMKFILSDHRNLEAFFYALTVQDQPFFPASKETWLVFQHWLRALKNEWHLWPNINPTTSRRDTEWKLFDTPKISHWSQWITRFAVEYHFFILYPATKQSAMIFGSTSMPFFTPPNPNMVPFFSITGEIIPSPISELAANISEFAENSIIDEPTVSITVISSGFLSMAFSWLCNVDLGGFRPPGVVWLATDQNSYNSLKKVRGTKAVHALIVKNGISINAQVFGSQGYWQLMLERTRLIGEILNTGTSVFAFETDQIWLEDPLPAVRQALAKGVDVVGTYSTGVEIGGNFLYLRSTVATRRLWLEVTNRFETSYRNYLKGNDSSKSYTLIENDQTLITKQILFDHGFQKANPVIFRFLDPDRFVDGTWYLEKNRYVKKQWSKAPIIINNNFIIGVEKKIRRAKEQGHWFLKDENSECDGSKKALFQKHAVRFEKHYEFQDVVASFLRRRTFDGR